MQRKVPANEDVGVRKFVLGNIGFAKFPVGTRIASDVTFDNLFYNVEAYIMRAVYIDMVHPVEIATRRVQNRLCPNFFNQA